MGRRKHVLNAAVASLQSLGIKAIGLEGDVCKKEDASHIVEMVANVLGRLDNLINGAAGNFLVAPQDLSPNGFKTVMDIDTLGTFTMCHAAVKYLKQGGKGKGPTKGGVIISVQCCITQQLGIKSMFSAAKAAIDSLTRSLALEWGTDYSIQCKCYCSRSNSLNSRHRQDSSRGIWTYIRTVPFWKNWGGKWDIAMAAIFLASETGKHIDGVVLPVDGGLWLSKPRYSYISEEQLCQFSCVVEQRSRAAPRCQAASFEFFLQMVLWVSVWRRLACVR